MASSSKKDEDSATNHVLDYYKKFSQNKELPKYFSGTSLSYLPAIKDESDSEPTNNVSLKTDIDIAITPAEKQEFEAADISPTSSLISNRKLEWDNGADIGYENCHLVNAIHRSSSLPLLDGGQKDDFNSSQIGKSEVSTASSSNVKLVIFTHSSDSGSNSPPVIVKSTSSSFHEEKKVMSSSSSSATTSVKIATSTSSESDSKQPISDFKNTISYLKKKIGLPKSQSTPYPLDENMKDSGQCFETPVVQKSDKPIRQLTKELRLYAGEFSNSDSGDKDKPPKIRSVLKKSNGGKEILNTKKKVVTLCLTKPLMVECTSSLQKPKNKVVQVKSRQSTVGIQTDNISEKELIKIIVQSQENVNQSVVYYEHSENSNVGSTQTSSDILASNCDSFEFIKNVQHLGEKNEDKIYLTSASSSKVNSEKYASVNNVDLAKMVSQKPEQTSNSQSSSEFYIENPSLFNHKNGSLTDIEKNIMLLQKLLKSKKYDSSTKKKYIKKLIQNITESKFLEDSSTSSELFFPRKSNSSNKYPAKAASTETSSEGNQSFPFQDIKVTPRQLLGIKTFSHNISPRKPTTKDELTSTSDIIPGDAKDNRKNLFTLTNNEFSVNRETVQKPSSSKDASLEKYDSFSSANSYQNWKEDKTLSEKMLEGQHSSGDGNRLVKLADREREYQISRINNEIQHLEKLKVVLKNPVESKQTRKMTSVYKLSRESSTPSRKPRKYVIETQFNGRIPKHVNYNIEGKKYSVEKECPLNKDFWEPTQVTGDIEVQSSDTTMKIKVTAFCETCKRSPCVCVTDFLDGLINPFECPNTLATCGSCKKASCSCSSSAKTICLICHQKCCVCKSTFSRRCSICKSAPCSCSCSYVGQFLPAELPNGVEDRFVGSSKSRKSQSLCSACGNNPCTCQKVVTSDCATQKEDMSQKATNTEYGSLRRVFENCACNTEISCNCNFVDKILKHFDVKNVETVASKPECNYEHIGIQTSFETENKNSQTSKNDDENIVQTDIKTSSDCQNISVQTEFHTKNQNSQTVQKYFDSRTIQTEVIDQNIACTHKETIAGSEEPEKVEVYTNSSRITTAYRTSNQIPQTVDVPKTNVSQQIALGNEKIQIEKCDKSTSILLRNVTDNEKTHCVCIQTRASTYPIDKKSQSIVNRSKKRITFIGSDSELVKVQRKQSIGCNCKINSDEIYDNTLHRPLSSTESSRVVDRMKIDDSTGQQKVKTSSVGTCRCGFSDKVYSDKGTKRSSDFVESRPNEAYSGTASDTNSPFEKTATSDMTSSGPSIVCICCEQSKTVGNISILAHNDREFPLCHDCLEKRPMLTSVCYTGPGQIPSNVSTETDKVCSSDGTTLQTENEEYCTCTKPSLMKNSEYCLHCRNQLKKTLKSRNGIAYMLTLECDSPGKFKSKKRKKKPLEEIKVKVPGPRKVKNVKDKENFKRKSSEKVKKNSKTSGEENSTNLYCSSTIESGDPVVPRRGLTLQDYLKQNRPDFINAAEFRRQMMNDYRIVRELTTDQVKLKFLEEKLQSDELNRQHKLFNEKEMKEITRRNYKKLPEVQQKQSDDKHRRLRTADKFIVDTFAKKIQRSVLKGKRDFPIDRNIVSIVV